MNYLERYELDRKIEQLHRRSRPDDAVPGTVRMVATSPIVQRARPAREIATGGRSMRRTFGSPPQTIEEWLDVYVAETERARNRSLNPLRRHWFNGRVSGLKSALNLLRLERKQREIGR